MDIKPHCKCFVLDTTRNGKLKLETCCSHRVEKVQESEKCNSLPHFPIQTGKKMTNNRPDTITIIDSVSRNSLLIDPSRIFDFRIVKSEEVKRKIQFLKISNGKYLEHVNSKGRGKDN